MRFTIVAETKFVVLDEDGKPAANFTVREQSVADVINESPKPLEDSINTLMLVTAESVSHYAKAVAKVEEGRD